MRLIAVAGTGRTSVVTSRRFILARRPNGMPVDEDFALESVELPPPGEGEVVLRTIYLSLDPYMRSRMNDGPSYAAPVALGGVMVGGTVSVVVESRAAGFAPGDVVLGYTGWQDHAVVRAASLRKLDPAAAPISAALGVLGMTGLTAYVGLLDIGRPKPGETVVVAAASGAVGSIVGQIARIRGARAVGIAGSDQKLAYLRDELGFDAAISRRSPRLAEDLAAACPKGVDVYFESVGGAVLDAVVPLFAVGARMPLCGMIAQYNGGVSEGQRDRLPRFLAALLAKRVMVRGFIVGDHQDRMAVFQRDMAAWLREGRIRYREDIVDGLENAVEAFRGLLEGRNFGKLLIRVSPDPTRS